MDSLVTIFTVGKGLKIIATDGVLGRAKYYYLLTREAHKISIEPLIPNPVSEEWDPNTAPVIVKIDQDEFQLNLITDLAINTSPVIDYDDLEAKLGAL